MIVQITNRSHQHYGHYGIVYKDSEVNGRKQILFLLDDNNRVCVRAGWSFDDSDFRIIPDEENRDTFGWPPALCDSKIHTVAGDLASLVRDGRRWRELQSLLKEK